VEPQRKEDSDPANEMDRLRNLHLHCMGPGEVLDSKCHYRIVLVIDEQKAARGANSSIPLAVVVGTVGHIESAFVDKPGCDRESHAGTFAWSRTLPGPVGNVRK